MKKQLFSFVMMLALVIVAGTTFGQAPGTKTKPYKGGTYSYTLGGIKVNTTGYAVISYSGTDAIIKNVEGNAGNYVADTHIAITSGSTFELNFDISYGDNATGGDILVIVTDGATDGCTNRIKWTITPSAAPTLALKVTTTAETPYCQATSGNSDNVDAATNSSNSINYTIAPITGAGTGYSYEFNLAVTPSAFGTYTLERVSGTGDVSSTGAVTNAVGTIVIKATWTTTTGLPPTDIVGTISASKLHLSVPEGGDIIDGTQVAPDNTATITVKSTPAIGSFN